MEAWPQTVAATARAAKSTAIPMSGMAMLPGGAGRTQTNFTSSMWTEQEMQGS